MARKMEEELEKK